MANSPPVASANACAPIAGDLNRAGILTQLHDDLAVVRWQKLVWNIPYNGLSVVLDATTSELMTNPQTRQLVEQIMWEVVADGTRVRRGHHR